MKQFVGSWAIHPHPADPAACRVRLDQARPSPSGVCPLCPPAIGPFSLAQRPGRARAWVLYSHLGPTRRASCPGIHFTSTHT